MTKPTITRLWVAGLITAAVGLIIGGIAMGLMLTNGGHWVPSVTTSNGSEFIPSMDSYFWTSLSVMIVGFAIAAIGGVVDLAAWIGALVNTYRIEDKTWFAVLLAGGLIGLAFGLAGFAAMLAYVLAGPDGMPTHAARQEALPPTLRVPTLTPTPVG